MSGFGTTQLSFGQLPATPLAQTVIVQPGTRPVEAPFHTITRQNKESGAGPYARVELPLGLIGIILGVAVCMGLLAWWINRRAKRRPSAETRAFLRLARKYRLGRAGRGLAMQLAGEVGTAPVALLTSPGVLRAALEQVDQNAWSSRPGWARLAVLAGEAGRAGR